MTSLYQILCSNIFLTGKTPFKSNQPYRISFFIRLPDHNILTVYTTPFVPQLMYAGEKNDWYYTTTHGGARTFNIEDNLLNKCKLIIKIEYSTKDPIIQETELVNIVNTSQRQYQYYHHTSIAVGSLQHVKIEFSQFHFLFPDKAHTYGDFYLDLHVKSHDDFKVDVAYKTELEQSTEDLSRISNSIIQNNEDNNENTEFEPMKIEYLIGSLLPRAETTRAPSTKAPIVLEWKADKNKPLIVNFDCYTGSLSRYYLTFTVCKKQVSDLFPPVEICHGSLTLSDGRINVSFEAKTIMYFTKFDYTDLSFKMKICNYKRLQPRGNETLYKMILTKLPDNKGTFDFISKKPKQCNGFHTWFKSLKNLYIASKKDKVKYTEDECVDNLCDLLEDRHYQKPHLIYRYTNLTDLVDFSLELLSLWNFILDRLLEGDINFDLYHILLQHILLRYELVVIFKGIEHRRTDKFFTKVKEAIDNTTRHSFSFIDKYLYIKDPDTVYAKYLKILLKRQDSALLLLSFFYFHFLEIRSTISEAINPYKEYTKHDSHTDFIDPPNMPTYFDTNNTSNNYNNNNSNTSKTVHSISTSKYQNNNNSNKLADKYQSTSKQHTYPQLEGVKFEDYTSIQIATDVIDKIENTFVNRGEIFYTFGKYYFEIIFERLYTDSMEVDFTTIPGFLTLGSALCYDVKKCQDYDRNSNLWDMISYFSISSPFLSHILSIFYDSCNSLFRVFEKNTNDTLHNIINFFHGVYTQFFVCHHQIQYTVPIDSFALRHSVHSYMIIQQISNYINSERVHKSMLGLVFIDKFWEYFDINIEVHTIKTVLQHFTFLSSHYNPIVQKLFIYFIQMIQKDQSPEIFKDLKEYNELISKYDNFNSKTLCRTLSSQEEQFMARKSLDFTDLSDVWKNKTVHINEEEINEHDDY